jgi:hypothetical protein
MNGDDPVRRQGVLWFGRAAVRHEHGSGGWRGTRASCAMAKSMPPLIEVRSAKARGALMIWGGKILGGGLVANDGPVDDDLLPATKIMCWAHFSGRRRQATADTRAKPLSMAFGARESIQRRVTGRSCEMPALIELRAFLHRSSHWHQSEMECVCSL